MGHAPSESNSRYLDGMRAVLSWCCRPTCGVDNRNSRIRLTQPLRYVFGPGLSGGTMQVMKQVSLGVPAIKQVKNQTPFLDQTIPPANGRGRGGFEVEARLESSAVGLGVVPAPLAPHWRYPRRPHMLLTGRTHGLHRDTRRHTRRYTQATHKQTMHATRSIQHTQRHTITNTTNHTNRVAERGRGGGLRDYGARPEADERGTASVQRTVERSLSQRGSNNSAAADSQQDEREAKNPANTI